MLTDLYLFVLPDDTIWRGAQSACGHPRSYQMSDSWSERNGQQDVHQVNEGRKEGRSQGGRCEAAEPAQDRAEVAARRLLLGGNPQIAKAYGDAPVQAYIAAMPGWKRDVGRRLDALIVRTVPGVAKAVKWNSPFYGIEGQELVPRLPLLHELRQSDFLPRRVAASCPARQVQAQGRALPRYP